jgi:hypothetical protein
MGFTAVSGIDFTLPSGPPLTQPPLTLLDLSILLLDIQGQTDKLRVAMEKAASATEQLSDLGGQISTAQAAVNTAQSALEMLTDEERDQPGVMDAVEDAKRSLAQLNSEYGALGDEAMLSESFASDLAKRLSDLSRWEHGFVYLPELSNALALETFAPDSTVSEVNVSLAKTALKNIGSNQAPGSNPFYWYDPYVVIGRDDRSLFGWPMTDFESRAQRAYRALVGHEAWQVEYEFWSGVRIPTNFHLTASPNTPVTSPHRTIDPWPNPDPAPGTVLGVAVGLSGSLSALDQAIADSESGTGMIHATPFLMQEWMARFNYIRDTDGKVYTVNHNLLVPGYGYGGTGPDQVGLTLADFITTAGSPIATSTTGGFNADYLGRAVTQTAGASSLPPGTYIIGAPNTNTVTLSQPATASHTISVSVAGTGGHAGGSTMQWAYATEMVYTLRGDINTYPYDLREGSPLVTVDNSIDVRAERSWATITNRFLRAAVLIDTTVS